MSSRLDELKAALAGRYEIESELGQGGMASVYLATDVRHQRQVAVKVLRPDLAAALGPDRFLREIRIAANLTHPHILPLHDSGEAGGFLYYVMPYIKGQTLRERIEKEGELPVAESVRIIREVVDALAFAHSQGVVHRDIKPDNVMLAGGHAIVADFGVAKAVSEATGRDKLTTAGVALGTPAYMAPEQATADPHVDHRADIYAVGAMAYELLAGRTPFVGATPQSILAAHVTEQAEPVSKHRDQVSADLEAVIMKCLAKKPADRWQTAGDMLPHLEALGTSSGGLTPAATMPVAAVPSRGKFSVARMTGGVAILAVVGILGTRLLRRDALEIVLSNSVQVTYGPEIDFEPDLSDDGSTVTYSSGTGLRSSVMSKSLGDVIGARSLELASVAGSVQRFPRFGSNNLVLFAEAIDGGTSRLVRVAETGGTPREIGGSARAIGGDWDPTATRIAYSLFDSIMIVDVEGGNPELLALVPPPGDAHSLNWSPDGQWIAFVNGNSLFIMPGILGNVAPASIWTVRVEDGEMVRITTDEDLNVSPAWLPDSRHLLFVSDREGPRDAFAVRVGAGGAAGEVQRLGIPEPFSLAVSADGSRLAYARFSFNRNIRSYPLGERTPVSVAAGVPVTTGSQVVENHDISSDGEWILYDSNLNGNQDIFRRRLAGGPVIPVTTSPANEFSPDLSPDGNEIAYHSIRDGRRRVFVRSIDGGPETEISGEHRATYPQWSPNGLQIVYGGSAGAHLVTRDRVGGTWGAPQLLPWPPAPLMGEWIPDGSAVVFSDGTSIWRATLDGGLRRLVLGESNSSEPRAPTAAGRPRVPRDGSTVFFEGVDGDQNQGIWSVPATGGQPCVMGDDGQPVCDDTPLAEPRLVVEFDSPSMVMYAAAISVSSDRIYLSIAEYESDIYVMDLEY